MIRSMTGFGDASAVVDSIHYAVEIRSTNNKFFKVLIRLPDALEGLEAAIESRLRRRLIRGSIVLTVKYSDPTASAAHELNLEAMRTYLMRLSELPEQIGRPVQLDAAALISLPGVLQPPADFEHQVERAEPIIARLVDEACDKLIAMRESEGRMLLGDLHRQGEAIERRLEVIAQRAPAVVEEYHQRLRQRIESMLRDAAVTLGEADLIREVAIYAERSDIAEEITRLTAHLAQFRDLIDNNSRDSVGRTLDFLAQELLREANTIASKSNDAQISREIVEIKGAIDRIKEQVQNVE